MRQCERLRLAPAAFEQMVLGPVVRRAGEVGLRGITHVGHPENLSDGQPMPRIKLRGVTDVGERIAHQSLASSPVGCMVLS